MLLIVNHKANFLLDDIVKYEKKIRKYKIIVLPSYCFLPIFKKGKYILGSQDISEFDDEKKTGEIIGKTLKDLNVKYTLIGHSERKIYNKESNEVILNKLRNCYNNDITPLYCIGETEEGDYETLSNQIDIFINNFKDKELYLIYEPVYNIGKKEPNLLDLENKINFINDYLNKNDIKNYKIIYGGGINKDTINTIKNINYLDGLIVSSSGLNIKDLNYIYENTK